MIGYYVVGCANVISCFLKSMNSSAIPLFIGLFGIFMDIHLISDTP